MSKTIKQDSLVSIIIPVYNGEKYLTEAISSILRQTYKCWEIIVIDDGSTDSSAKIARSFDSQVRYFKNEVNRGLATTLNRGIGLCQGEYITFLDQDDLWVEDKLTWQIQAFLDNPQLEAVFGHVQQFKSPELDEDSKKRLQIPVEVIPGYSKISMAITHKALHRIGLFDPSTQIDFVEWYLRASEKDLNSLMLPQVIAKRRLHATNMVLGDRKWQNDYPRLLKASLDRRRKLGLLPKKNDSIK